MTTEEKLDVLAALQRVRRIVGDEFVESRMTVPAYDALNRAINAEIDRLAELKAEAA